MKDLPAPNPPLTVLMLNSLYPPFVVGGAEVVTEMLARTLVTAGHKVSVVTSCSREEGSSRALKDGVDVRRFFPKNRWWLYERFRAGDRRSTMDKIRWRITDAWNRGAGAMFADVLDSVRPDIVHTHNIKGFSPIVWRMAKDRGIPVVHTAHSYELMCADGSLLDRHRRSCDPGARCAPCKLHGSWYRAQAAAIDIVCSPSNYLLQAHADAGIAPRRTALVRNGVQRNSRSRLNREPAPTGAVNFVYLGQLATHKGIHTLIEAIRLTQDPNLRFDIAGRGDAETELKALARTDDRVRFHGFVDGARKQHLMEQADALVFPSVWIENAPMSIAEALCNGLPVLGSDLGAIPEFVEHGRNGLLFEPGNAAALALCMLQLLERPDHLRRLKDGAHQSGDHWPTTESMTAEYLGVYRSLRGLNAADLPACPRQAAPPSLAAANGELP